jgi:hypothetical protein
MKPGQLYFKFPNKTGYICVPLSAHESDEALIDVLTATMPGVTRDCFFRCSSNKIVERLGDLPHANNNFVQVIPRVRAGKGGFGTLMKNQAMQMRRFTDTYAAKDLNGRKMRDVKNEIKLKKWILRRTENRSKAEQEQTRASGATSDRLRTNKPVQVLTESKKFVKNVSTWNNAIQESIVQGLKSAHRLQSQPSTSDDSGQPQENSNKLESVLSNLVAKHKITSPPETTTHSNSNTSDNQISSQDKTERENNQTPTAKADSTIDLSAISSIDELKAFDPEVIKNYLKSIGVKCGGTADERVKRLWDIKCDPALLFDKRYLAPKPTNN